MYVPCLLCPITAALPLCSGCDVLVHECTNTLLAAEVEAAVTVALSTNNDSSSSSSCDTAAVAALAVAKMTADTVSHGHSTAAMAGAFARACSARRLVLTHFSARYKGDDSCESVAVMSEIEQQARAASALQGDCVVAAWDLCTVPVPYAP
jgi:ribonuclease BN (tRNA processing enzyme)